MLQAIDEKVSDGEGVLSIRGLAREGLWEEMTFELRPENMPARSREKGKSSELSLLEKQTQGQYY